MSFETMMRGYTTDTLPLEDMLYVKGKVAIVTGGTSGLGFCVAQRLCQGGAKVVIAGSTDEKGRVALELLQEKGYEVSFCKTDLCLEIDVAHLVDFTAKTYGSVDILVTSGGSWSFAHIQDMPEDAFIKTLDINLVGAFRCAKHVSKNICPVRTVNYVRNNRTAMGHIQEVRDHPQICVNLQCGV